MKSTFIGVFGLLVFTTSIFAQVSPTPVINNEMRDGSSMRRRAMDLEQFKREAEKPNFKEPSKALAIKFAEIKEDFEGIQKLENQIIQAYIKGKQINYQKISDLAFQLSRKAVRLEVNLFIPKSDKPDKIDDNNQGKSSSIKDLIIELDNEIGAFVQSPIFTNNKIVDSKVSEKSQLELEQIIKLSEILSKESKKFN
jgi:hypothetical protein